MELRYLTRDKNAPGKRAGVFFCCHPEDLAKQLRPISDELFHLQDCVLWYCAEREDAREAEQLWETLSGMQLFVIPVTRRFLAEENTARESWLPFALSHGIPVLPLMRESGLTALFGAVCGGIQFLDAAEPDQTAVPYRKKLARMLEATLVGDALAEKIRASFKACVFLSYRKKDRRAAKELMRLIHCCEGCRDVAVWYDEFLVPGEKFHEEIKKAIGRSRLFVLAVTPHLLEDGNYVMQEEYPYALCSEKPVLPVEMEQSDERALASCFPGLPDCVAKADGALLTKKLGQALSGTEQSADTPEHLLLIGLAYLKGVDVETDRRRALQLIECAAAKDYPDAVRQLAHMFRYGDGAKQDWTAAAAWQKRLVGLLWERCRQLPEDDTAALRFGEALDELGSCYADAGNREKYRAFLPLSERLCAGLLQSGCGSEHIRAAQITAVLAEGMLAVREDLNFDRARETFLRAEQLVSALPKNGVYAEIFRPALKSVGTVAKALGAFDSRKTDLGAFAETTAREAERMEQLIASHFGERTALSAENMRLHALWMELRVKTPEGEARTEAFSRILETAEHAARAGDFQADADTLVLAADTLTFAAECCVLLSEETAAERYFEQALQLLLRPEAKANEQARSEELRENRREYALFCRKRGRFEEAERALWEARGTFPAASGEDADGKKLTRAERIALCGIAEEQKRTALLQGAEAKARLFEEDLRKLRARYGIQQV